MKILLARHGQAEWQVKRTRDWDTPLTALGQRQAQSMAYWLANGGFGLQVAQVRASPLKRATQTAAYTACALDLPVVVQESLREARFKVGAHLPWWQAPFEPPVCASVSTEYDGFKRQARAALEELVQAAEAAGGPVLAVAHGGLVKTLLRDVARSDALSFRIYNAALTVLEWRRGRWHLVHLNLWDHLPGELRTE